jgi:hypothetical protein
MAWQLGHRKAELKDTFEESAVAGCSCRFPLTVPGLDGYVAEWVAFGSIDTFIVIHCPPKLPVHCDSSANLKDDQDVPLPKDNFHTITSFW